jgi:hypothetical protein
MQRNGRWSLSIGIYTTRGVLGRRHRSIPPSCGYRIRKRRRRSRALGSMSISCPGRGPRARARRLRGPAGDPFHVSRPSADAPVWLHKRDRLPVFNPVSHAYVGRSPSSDLCLCIWFALWPEELSQAPICSVRKTNFSDYTTACSFDRSNTEDAEEEILELVIRHLNDKIQVEQEKRSLEGSEEVYQQNVLPGVGRLSWLERIGVPHVPPWEAEVKSLLRGPGNGVLKMLRPRPWGGAMLLWPS